MKKFAGAAVVFSFFILASGNSSAQGINEDDLRAEQFRDKAMAEFKSVNDPAMDYTAVSSRIEETALKISKVLLDNQIKDKEAAMLMDNTAIWYGQALELLFKGKNFDQVIEEYSGKVADLLHKENMDLGIQMSIIGLVSNDLQKMNSLFHDVLT